VMAEDCRPALWRKPHALGLPARVRTSRSSWREVSSHWSAAVDLATNNLADACIVAVLEGMALLARPMDSPETRDSSALS